MWGNTVSLFRQGHTPSSALHCLKTDLLIAHDNEYYRFAADYGAMLGADMFAALEQLLVSCEKQDCKSKLARVGDNNSYVSLCTPIMTRAHEVLPQTAELVMVDAAGGLDKQWHRLYLFVSPNPAGSVPAGAIINRH